jgi:trans-aconitate methyltransferase
VIALKRPLAESAIFPWLRELDGEEQQEFLHEYTGRKSNECIKSSVSRANAG